MLKIKPALTINNRITFLLTFLAITIVSTLVVFAFYQNKQLKIYQELKINSDQAIVDNILSFKSQTMINFTIDNAAWDMSVNFLKEKDTLWALENYETTRITYGLSAIAVYDKQGKLFYCLRDSIMEFVDFHQLPVLEWFERKTHFGAHYLFQGQLFQVTGSLIVPSWDIDFVSPPYGYFLMFQLWDQHYLDELKQATGFNIHFSDQNVFPFPPKNLEIISFPLKDASENTIGTLYFFREDRLVKAINPIWSIMVGISMGVLLLIGLYVYLTRQWFSRPLNHIAQTLREGKVSAIESYLQKEDEFGEIARLIKTYHDQKQLLEKEIKERKEANEKFQTLLQAQPDIMLVVDHTGNVLFHYAPDDRLWGKLFETSPQRNIKDMKVPLLSDNFIRITRELTGTKKVKSLEFERDTGSERFIFEARIICIDHLQFLIILRDITNLRRIEYEILKTKELLEQTNRIAQLGAWEYFPDRKVSILSKITREIFELDEEFTPNLSNLIQFFRKGESRRKFIEALRAVYKTGRSFETEAEIITMKGNEKWVRLNCTPEVSDGKMLRIYGIVQDITRQKKVEEQLIISEKNLRELNAAKDQFFSIIAHDLKTPFNGILGFAELLMMDAIHLDRSEVVNYAGIIVESARQALQLLENLLDWARIQQGRIIFQPRRILLSDLVDDCILYITESAHSKNIAVHNTIPRNFIIRADYEMLKTIIRNLLSNAVKFTHPGGKITISAQTVDNEIQISVSDTGIGIKDELINNLFKIDPQKIRAGTASEKGTGFGLILCKDFVERHGGRIWVNSQLYKGSVFTFAIPQDLPYPAESTRNLFPEPELKTPVNKISVLVVEDDPFSAVAIAKMLEKEYVQVDIAYDGFKAIEFCRENPNLDLIFMDMTMSDMNGLETTRKIREFNKNVIIIALTAIANKEMQREALLAGCNDFISKPYDSQTILEIIRKYFSDKPIISA